MENTLPAYQAAWAAGLHLCECDVTASKDGHLVLCHDGTFARLGTCLVPRASCFVPQHAVSRKRRTSNTTFEPQRGRPRFVVRCTLLRRCLPGTAGLLGDGLCEQRVADLTVPELMRLPLRGGSRPPLLADVLRTATHIGAQAQMVVEIKVCGTVWMRGISVGVRYSIGPSWLGWAVQ